MDRNRGVRAPGGDGRREVINWGIAEYATNSVGDGFTNTT